jgi:hypothetical protein
MLFLPFVIMTELPGDRLDVNNVGGQLKVRIVPWALHHAFLFLFHPRSVLLADVLELHLLQRSVLGDVGLPIEFCLRVIGRKGPPIFFLPWLLNDSLDTQDVVVVISWGTEVNVTLALIYELIEY